MANITLDKILIYPIKGLNGLEVDSSEINISHGLKWDRQWSFKSEDGKYVNGKNEKRVHLIRAEYDMAKFIVGLSYDGGQIEHFSLKNDQKTIGNWMSAILGQTVNFSFTEKHFSDDQHSPGPTLISQASLETVAKWFNLNDIDNVRNRFRANLEIKGCLEFWEDSLVLNTDNIFSIGKAKFEAQNICKRCVVPTRDPATGVSIEHFMKRFIELRKSGLKEKWPDKFENNFYRLAINTQLLPSEENTIIKKGDILNPPQ